MGIKTALGAIKAFGSRHSTAITVGLSIVGYACCIATTISETRTFDARIEELKISNNGAEVPKKEIAKAAVKSYWLTAVIFGVSTTSLIMGQRAAYKKTMALTTAYQMTEKAFREYKGAVAKTLTEKKQKEVDAAADQAIAERALSSVNELPENPGNGMHLHMDRWTGRYFYANCTELELQFNKAIKDFERGEDISCNDILQAWGLNTDNNCNYGSEIGANMGWRYDYLGEDLEFVVTSTNIKIGSEIIPVNVVGSRQPPHCYISL